MMLRGQQQRANGMGGLGAVTLTPAMRALGYRQDHNGAIYYPDGKIFYDPFAMDERERLTGQGGNAYTLDLFNRLQGVGTPGQLTPEQIQLQALLLAQQKNAGGVSGSIDGSGINFMGTQISWPVLMIGILGIVLLQSRGIERKK
jgi:hypothetical protein